MPGGGDIFGRARLFGVNIRIVSDRRDALEAALALCPPAEPGPADGPSVSVTLRSGVVGGGVHADRFAVLDDRLMLCRDGFRLRADGRMGEGLCLYPPGTAVGGGTFADMVDTLLLFLAAQAGRTPLHASAIMLDDTAFVLAGRSGTGKSSLALAADRAGLAVLSDDTVYVQTQPALRVWAAPRAIHVFEQDAPAGAGAMRYRSGRWKRALPIAAARPMAERAVLCVLARGKAVGLQRLDVEEAVAILTRAPEPGYDFYGARMAAAVRALAQGGCWRLTLSADPREAVDLLRRRFGGGERSFHHRYMGLVHEIERNFPVAQWRLCDVPIWPLARFDLYVDMHRAAFGGGAPGPRPLPLRLAAALIRPLINRWRGRRDPAHRIYRPGPADAVLLGDGVSRDKVDGAYRDRFGEPVMEALEREGKSVLAMQPGDPGRLPWRRAIFPASAVDSGALLVSLLPRGRAHLSQHAALMAFLSQRGIAAPSLSARALRRRARLVAAAARMFARILARVDPSIAFVVNAAAGLGPAFVLACRRHGILSVDLQRSPRAGAPMAHDWAVLPEEGYATLPALFWTWAEEEPPLLPPSPWHRALHGGHTQLAPFQDDDDPVSVAWDEKFCNFGTADYEREILVALQPIGGEAVWNALAEAIAASPSAWRWWIRRHPAMRPEQDAAFGRLLSLARPNVVIDPPFPLPALLRHMSALVSLASGAAAEASFFGVPALFLSDEATGPFGALFASGAARRVAVEGLAAEIAGLPGRPLRPPRGHAPALAGSLKRLEALAREYRKLCAGTKP